MNKRGTITTDDAELTDINISPMIDMVFILLIFFIVTTTFVREPGVDIDRERANTAEDRQNNSILIAITAQGEVYYGGDPIGVAGVRGVVRRLTNDQPNMPVILQTDRNAPAQIVIQVVAEANYGKPGVLISIGTENL